MLEYFVRVDILLRNKAMEIETKQMGAITQVTISGRFDASATESVTENLDAILNEGGRHLRLDLSGVKYLSSAGIRVLLSFYKLLKELGGSLVITTPSTIVENVLEMAGFGSLMEFVPGSDDGLEAEPNDLLSSLNARYEIYHQSGAKKFLLKTIQADLGTTPEAFGKSKLGWGQGSGLAISSDEDRVGPFLALGGTVFVKDEETASKPDYFSASGLLVPEMLIKNGNVLDGVPAFCVRFQAKKTADQNWVSLGEILASIASTLNTHSMGFVLIGETPKQELSNAEATQAPGGGIAVLVGMAVFESDTLVKLDGCALTFAHQFMKIGRIEIAETLRLIMDKSNPQDLIRFDLQHAPLKFNLGAFWFGELAKTL